MIYTVKKGDRLSKIAAKFETTVDILVALNGIKDPNKIYVGETIEIPDQQIPEEEETITLMEEFFDHLYAQIGMPYVWGAQGQTLSEMDKPETWIRDRETSSKNADRAITYYHKVRDAGMHPIRAYDCSGLIMAFVQNEKHLIDCDLSARGIYGKCNALKKEELLPGDMVFRHNGSKVHHVGVYVGDGRVIEAMGRDVGVVIRNIDASGKGYWNRYGRWKILSR